MNKKIKIVYCLPSLYIPGGMERVLTIKANYFAEKLGYDIYIILTDGKGLEPFYALSPKVHLIHLDINFNELWNKPLYKKLFIYACKQRLYKKRLTKCLFEVRRGPSPARVNCPCARTVSSRESAAGTTYRH